MSKRITVYVEEEMYAFLKAESERTSVSICELIRRAIEWYFRLRNRWRVMGVDFHLSLLRRRGFGRRSGVPFDR